MGRSIPFGVVMCAVLLVAATTRSEVTSYTDVIDDTASLPEPIMGTPTEPAAAEPSPSKDPFAPYDVGPPDSRWPAESMTPEEQAVIERGRDTTGWRQTHSEYATAVKGRSREARAGAAQHALGIDSSFEYAGVVK